VKRTQVSARRLREHAWYLGVQPGAASLDFVAAVSDLVDPSGHNGASQAVVSFRQQSRARIVGSQLGLEDDFAVLGSHVAGASTHERFSASFDRPRAIKNFDYCSAR
jgi:hypothetical protein